MTELNLIAQERIYATRVGGERIAIDVCIGTPYRVEGIDVEEWACPVSLRPLYRQLQDAHGTSSLHALCMALALAMDLLDKFREDGGKLCHSDGTEFDLKPFAFGAATRRGNVV